MRLATYFALPLALLAACVGTDSKQETSTSTPAAPYTLTAFDATRINSHQNQPNFQHADAEVDFHDGPFAKAVLIADLISPCYPFDKWDANPPPNGQYWPADCDAFDRNFEFLVDPPAKGATGAPPAIEIVRAITPFGGPMHIEQPITDLANAKPGKHTVRVTIATWSDGAGKVSGSNGGWIVNARIEVTPGTAPRKVLGVFPLYNGSVTDAAGPGPLEFTLPEGTTGGRIEYRITGHGGAEGDADCIGPAEEFCMREYTVKLDDAPLDVDPQPWRSDCQDNCTLKSGGPFGGQYCEQNPCGSIASVRAPRANWCPSTVTPPYVWSGVPGLQTPGKHTFTWTVSKIAAGGSWRTSAVVYAFGE